MSGLLPLTSLKPSRFNPRILVLYGKPKVGKTKIISDLPSCLVADAEGGADMYSNIRIRVTSLDGPVTKDKDGNIVSAGLFAIYDLILEYGGQLAAAGKPVQFPYTWIALDTLDKIEDYAEALATSRYKASPIGKNFEGKSVLELPNGAGYYHLRNEVLDAIDKISSVCKYLILVTHVKEKLLNKGGVEVSSTDISLTGKLGQMVCAKADAIGYLYREQGKNMMVSFATNEGAVMGARFPHLAGQKFEFDWKKIYLDEPLLSQG